MSKQFQLREGVIIEVVEDEAILLNLNDNLYYGLDDIATRICQLLVEHGNIETVVGQMLKEYRVDEATLRNDIIKLVEEMERRGLFNRVAT